MSTNQEEILCESNIQVGENLAPCILSCEEPKTENFEQDYSNKISYTYICGLCSSILFHLLDAGTDLYLAYQYYLFKQKNYCILTLIFFIIPALINTLISLRMYADEEGVTSKKWIFRSILLFLMLAPLVRYFETLVYAIKLKRNNSDNNLVKFEKYYKPLLKEDSNLALLRVIECFLEAAPQQVLQIAILLRMEDQTNNSLLKIYQCITISTSLGSIAWSFAIYNRSIRFAREDKRKMSWIGSFAQFTWLLCITTARILSLGAAASVFPQSTFMTCVVHWITMTVWLTIFERTWFCYSSRSDTTCKIRRTMEVFFCAVLGLVYIFAFLPYNDGPTRYKYIFYYFVCFIENITAVLSCVVYSYPVITYPDWFSRLAVSSIVLFFIGIFSMIIYYTYYHPEIGLINRPRNGDKSKNNSHQLYDAKEQEIVEAKSS